MTNHEVTHNQIVKAINELDENGIMLASQVAAERGKKQLWLHPITHRYTVLASHGNSQPLESVFDGTYLFEAIIAYNEEVL